MLGNKIVKIRLMTVAVLFTFSFVLIAWTTVSAQTSGKHRLIVITDIGNEPDDFMSMVRLMVYSNQIDIEGLIASTSIHQSKKINNEWYLTEMTKATNQLLTKLKIPIP